MLFRTGWGRSSKWFVLLPNDQAHTFREPSQLPRFAYLSFASPLPGLVYPEVLVAAGISMRAAQSHVAAGSKMTYVVIWLSSHMPDNDIRKHNLTNGYYFDVIGYPDRQLSGVQFILNVSKFVFLFPCRAG